MSTSRKPIGQYVCWKDSALWAALLTAWAAALPLVVGPGIVNTRAGGDSPFLLLRVQQMSKALREGAFPVRWMPDAAYGLGYPAFHYYAALPYYVAAFLDLNGLGVLWGIKVTQSLAFLLAGGAAYALGRQMRLSRPAALAASALYTLAPFHLVNAYVRGDALSEFFAMALFPLILWAFGRLKEKSTLLRIVGAGASYAALVLSHNISALLFSPFLLLYILFLHPWPWAASRRRGLLMAGGAVILGLALSAWFWVPALAEQGFAQLTEQTTGYFHFANHFRGVNLVQWRAIHDYAIEAGRDPFNMGLVQALIGLGGLGAWGFALVRRRDVRNGAWGWVVATALLTTWLITPLSRPVWERVPLLPMVQFPWRFLGLQALAVALLSAWVIEVVPPRGRFAVSYALCALAMVTSLAGLRLDRLTITEADITPERLMLYETYSGNIGGTVRYEYLPREMVPRPYTSAVQWLGGAKPAPLVLSGSVPRATLLAQRATREEWDIVVQEEALLAFHTTYFPGWRAVVDGQRRPVLGLEGLGLIGLRLERGEHRVSLRLGATPLCRAAEILSGCAWAIALVVWGCTVMATPKGRRKGFLALGLVLWDIVWVAWLAPRPAGEVLPGPLVMDFARSPYLHAAREGVHFGEAELLGYRLDRTSASPGETVRITFRWGGAWQGLRLRVSLMGASAHLFDDPPIWSDVAYDLTTEETDVLVPIPPETPPGLYVLRVRLYQEDEDLPMRTANGLKLARLALQPLWVVGAQKATGQEPALASFGPPQEPPVIRLVSVSQRTQGERVEFTLRWRSERQAPLNYFFSVRLIGGDGAIIAQKDVPPLLGGYPTSLWEPGTLITDRVILRVREAEARAARDAEIILYDRYTLQAVGTARMSLAEIPATP